MEHRFDQLLLRLRYRYEVLLLAAFATALIWPMYAKFQGVVASFVVLLVVLDARSKSQFKRGSEDMTAMDKLLAAIPFRYEVLCGVAVLVWLAWWFSAGATGFMLGLGIVMLALSARSSSQMKRGAAVTIHEIE